MRPAFALSVTGPPRPSRKAKPPSFDEAQGSRVWRWAIDKEVGAHGTWDHEPVPLPAACSAISNAPVMRLAALQVCLALAVEKNRKMLAADVVTAYLNSELEEELYLRPLAKLSAPSGHAFRLPDAQSTVYDRRDAHRLRVSRKRLRRRVFGTFEPTTADRDFEPAWILTHIKQELFFKFKTTAGPLTSLLGLMSPIYQEAYTRELAAKYAVSAREMWSLSSSVMSLATINRRARIDTCQYISLFFMAMGTHSGIEFVVGFLGRQQSDPRQANWDTEMRAL
ncbi:MAG: hypothetical protein BJ554DRAFT_7824, partial [Olpidium bornovanus]